MARQTMRQKLNTLYASLGLNLRDNDPNSAEMQAAAMAAIEAYRAAERSGQVQIARTNPHLWGSSVRAGDR